MGLTASKGSAPSASPNMQGCLLRSPCLNCRNPWAFSRAMLIFGKDLNSSACIRSTQIPTSVRICKEMDRSNRLRKRYSYPLKLMQFSGLAGFRDESIPFYFGVTSSIRYTDFTSNYAKVIS